MSSIAATEQPSNDSLAGKRTRKVLRKIQPKPKPIKKYIWLAGHVLTLGFGAVYIVLYALRFFVKWYWIPRIAYRLTFIGVLASYSITVITTFGSSIPSYHTLLATENFQSLSLAVIWLISRPSAFKLFPYYTISLLQIASTYNIKAILKLQNKLGDFVAISEIFVFFALLFDTLLFRGTSGFALVIYVAFYWLRINFSPYTQAYILTYVKFIDDKIISKQKPAVQEKWNKVKEFIEFRRNQTKEVIERNLTEEPKLDVSAKEHPNANKALGETQNLQVGGTDQSLTKKPTNTSVTTSATANTTNASTKPIVPNSISSAPEDQSVSARLGRAASEVSQQPSQPPQQNGTGGPQQNISQKKDDTSASTQNAGTAVSDYAKKSQEQNSSSKPTTEQ